MGGRIEAPRPYSPAPCTSDFSFNLHNTKRGVGARGGHMLEKRFAVCTQEGTEL